MWISNQIWQNNLFPLIIWVVSMNYMLEACFSVIWSQRGYTQYVRGSCTSQISVWSIYVEIKTKLFKIFSNPLRSVAFDWSKKSKKTFRCKQKKRRKNTRNSRSFMSIHYCQFYVSNITISTFQFSTCFMAKSAKISDIANRWFLNGWKT